MDEHRRLFQEDLENVKKLIAKAIEKLKIWRTNKE